MTHVKKRLQAQTSEVMAPEVAITYKVTGEKQPHFNTYGHSEQVKSSCSIYLAKGDTYIWLNGIWILYGYEKCETAL